MITSWDPAHWMSVYIIFLLLPIFLLKPFQCALIGIDSICKEVLYEIIEYSDNLTNLRLVSKETKDLVDEYLLIRRKCSLRRWQLSCLIGCSNINCSNIDDFYLLNVNLYCPYRCINHMKLLKFISIHPEFHNLYVKLRSDKLNFLEPLLKYYSNQIHGYEEFIEIMRVDLVAENDDFVWSCSVFHEDYGIFFGLMGILQYMSV